MFQASKPALAAISGLIAATAQAGEPLQLPRPDGSQTPLQVYRPAGECRAVAVLSHGAGGSEQALAYLAEALQQAGWLALVPGHRESGRQVLRGEIRREGLRDGLLALTTDAAAYRARLEEIGTALQWGRGQCAGRFAVLLGHSMGAATVMLEAGAANRLGVSGGNRFDAYVALSPQGPGSIFPPQAWRGIQRPMLLLTGTRDQALEGEWTTRLLPFDDLPPGCHWLGVIRGASHANLGGGGFSAATQRAVTDSVLPYLDALRSGHCAALPVLPGISLRSKNVR